MLERLRQESRYVGHRYGRSSAVPLGDIEKNKQEEIAEKAITDYVENLERQVEYVRECWMSTAKTVTDLRAEISRLTPSFNQLV